MGEQKVTHDIDAGERREFMKRLLTDVQALEDMLAQGMIESGRRRIGAEQEVVLIDAAYRPALKNLEILERLDDPNFTTELAQFNLEFNLPPLTLGAKCLREMEDSLRANLERLRQVARQFDLDILLTGILPTLEPTDLAIGSLTDLPRYYALNDTLMALRGGPYQIDIKGVDELTAKQDSVLLEACNTSFQVHFQVSPEKFAHFYNAAQAISAPVLAAAANSPVLFGKRLWKETRIAVFHQSVDARDGTSAHRDLSPRVSFGTSWVRESALEIYREDISRFRVLFIADKEKDPFELIKAGEPPKLKALQTHNSTIYRWNRVCYGITEGKAHLRIENRYLPSGPTTLDEVANAAFWFGLLSGISHEYGDITTVMDFDVAKSNFFAAARHGLQAQFTWLDGKLTPAQGLICRRLLSLAREGLQELEIDRDDIDRYLGVIEGRVAGKQTGARWFLQSLAEMKGVGTKAERLGSVTATMARLQHEGSPVHEWPLARLNQTSGWENNYLRIEQYMTTNLFTVNQDEVIDLVANLMDWERIRHVPVEDNQHRLVGLVSYRTLLRFMARSLPRGISRAVPVSEIMRPDPITVTPETTTVDAIRIMRENGVACLPVVKEGVLVGIVTEHDFLNIAAALLEKHLKQD
ncbi:MAG: glutamate-cysteine ligase family protein [Phycisphaerales bacterium]|nr:glutamate-cysteine ligase family protein [Phycisphaerales bacterium]